MRSVGEGEEGWLSQLVMVASPLISETDKTSLSISKGSGTIEGGPVHMYISIALDNLQNMVIFKSFLLSARQVISSKVLLKHLIKMYPGSFNF